MRGRYVVACVKKERAQNGQGEPGRHSQSPVPAGEAETEGAS